MEADSHTDGCTDQNMPLTIHQGERNRINESGLHNFTFIEGVSNN